MIATDQLLMQLSDLDALPGQEAQVQQALQETIQGPITKDSFGNLYPIGGWWGHVVLGQQVRATCRKNGAILEGIVGTLSKTSHKLTEVVPINQMYIDFGVHSKSELEEAGMQIGDMILPNTKARKSFNQKKIMG